MRLRELPLLVFAVCAASAIGAVLAQGQDTPQTRMRTIGTFGDSFQDGRTLTASSPAWNDRSIWKWSPRQEHHNAAVIISAGSAGGSGTCISHNGKGVIVLTCDHVVEGYRSARVQGQGTGNASFQIIGRSARYDCAVLYNPNATTNKSLPLYGADPPLGSDLEVMGFGGPSRKLRHYVGQRIRSSSALSLNAPSISGDSGGGIVYQGAVVGVQYGGNTRTPHPRSWSLVYPASSNIGGDTLARFVTQICGPYQCQPQIVRQPSQGIMYPPANPGLVLNPPANPSGPTTKPGGCCCGKPGKDGADGADGVDGSPGPPGRAGTDAFLTDEEKEAFRLSIIAEIKQHIDGNPVFRGPKGDAGDAGTVDPVDLAGKIQPHLAPIKLVWVDENNKILRDENGNLQQVSARLGDYGPLRLSRAVIDASK